MRVRIDFNAPPSLYLDLTPAQIAALEDEYSWQPFSDACYEDISDHLIQWATIDNVVVT